MARLEFPSTPPTQAPISTRSTRLVRHSAFVCRRPSYRYTTSSKSGEEHVTVSQTPVLFSCVLSQALSAISHSSRKLSTHIAVRRLVKLPTPGILQVGDCLKSRYKGFRKRCPHTVSHVLYNPPSQPSTLQPSQPPSTTTRCVHLTASCADIRHSFSSFKLSPDTSPSSSTMAAMFARRPILTTAAATAVVGTAIYMSRPTPLRLDSAYREPSKTLSFPRSMLLSRELKVKQVEQVNHDTKRITFELPGGETEISGVPASCMQIGRPHSSHYHQLTLPSGHPHPTHSTRRLLSHPPPIHAHLTT
jgi:hypothetical protein